MLLGWRADLLGVAHFTTTNWNLKTLKILSKLNILLIYENFIYILTFIHTTHKDVNYFCSNWYFNTLFKQISLQFNEIPQKNKKTF